MAKLSFNPPDIKIRVNKEELNELLHYLRKCESIQLAPNNAHIFKVNVNHYIKWHIKEICSHVFNLLTGSYHLPNNKKILLKLTQIQQYTLSIVFDVIDCPPFLLPFQNDCLTGLQKS